MAKEPECHKCHVSGVKLWREYQAFSGLYLMCVDCCCKEYDIDPDSVSEDGTRLDKYDMKTDQMSWHVPAVFDEDGNCWGYTSVPEDAITNWHDLPLRKEKVASNG